MCFAYFVVLSWFSLSGFGRGRAECRVSAGVSLNSNVSLCPGVDRRLVDCHRSAGAVVGTGGDSADFLHHLETGRICRLAEGRILPVEVCHSFETNEKLRAGRVRIVGPGHREYAGVMAGGIEL